MRLRAQIYVADTFMQAATADDSDVPVILRMLLQYVEGHGMDKLGIYQTGALAHPLAAPVDLQACDKHRFNAAVSRKVETIQGRINDGPEYWLEADDTMSRDDAVLAAAELVRLYFQEQPDSLLVESESLADAVNTYRAGSEVSPT